MCPHRTRNAHRPRKHAHRAHGARWKSASEAVVNCQHLIYLFAFLLLSGRNGVSNASNSRKIWPWHIGHTRSWKRHTKARRKRWAHRGSRPGMIQRHIAGGIHRRGKIQLLRRRSLACWSPSVGFILIRSVIILIVLSCTERNRRLGGRLVYCCFFSRIGRRFRIWLDRWRIFSDGVFCFRFIFFFIILRSVVSLSRRMMRNMLGNRLRVLS